MEIREYKVMYEVEDSHFWYKGMRKITKTLFDKYLPKNKQLKILDAGCGTGRNILFLKNYGQVFGFDISPHAIKYCKKRGLKNIKEGSVDRIPFNNNSFDLITCFDVLYHKQVENYKKVIGEFYCVLKPGGVLFVRVPAFQFLMSGHDTAVHTKHRFHKTELKDILLSQHFRILKISYINTLLFPFAAIRRILKRFIIIETDKKSDVKKINPVLNFFLQFPLYLESNLIKYIDFPFGLSLIAMVKKKS